MKLFLEGLDKVLGRFKREIEERTRKEVELYIFGSYARGDFTGSSDIDLFLLVPEDWSKEDEIVTKRSQLKKPSICMLF